MKRRQEEALRNEIMRQVNAQVRAAAKPGEPDAWMRLVLSSMPAAELRAELASGRLSADEERWMRAELARKEA